MKKSWLIMFLAIGMSVNMPLMAATDHIEVVYNGNKLALSKAPILRFGKVWLPARTITEELGYSIRYEKADQMVYIKAENTSEIGFEVVPAGSARDDGNCPVLIEGTVYLSIRDVAEHLQKDIKWEQSTKTVIISNLLPIWVEETADLKQGELCYDTETGDFYNGKQHIAKLPFKYLDVLSADKIKTANNHVIYSVGNSFGEPHINDELYTVYVVGGVHHVAKSFKRGMNGNNYLLCGNKVVLIDRNVISIYDDVTGDRLVQHMISEAPLKAFLNEADEKDENYQFAKMGYMVEAVGDDFVLYRNYQLKTLTLLNLKTKEEVELYQAVYPEKEAKAIEEGPREEGDYLEFVKSENGVIYLKHIYTGQEYKYQY